jgi:poly(ADP-ribose) glycohydrolase ARH3
MPFEGWTTGEIARKFGQIEQMEEARLGAGTYTDDTEMMIGVAEVLIEYGHLDQQALADRLVSNFTADRGYGGGSLLVIKALRDGVEWEKAPAAAFSGGSFGNGAAMRIAPVGVMFHSNLNLLEKEAELSAKVTHTHRLGVEGAKLQALAVALATGSDSGQPINNERFLKSLKLYLNEKPFIDALDSVSAALAKAHDPEIVANDLGNDVTALRSVPASIYCFLKFNGDFKKSVSQAVCLGGDTDTIGAMTGALCGAHLGVEAIPKQWLDVLENGEKGRDYVMELGRSLYEIHLQ